MAPAKGVYNGLRTNNNFKQTNSSVREQNDATGSMRNKNTEELCLTFRL